jgi:hypothetical protein
MILSFEQYCESFIKLGACLYDFSRKYPDNNEFRQLVQNQHIYNSWLIEPFIRKSFEDWSARLSKESVEIFVAKYPELKDTRPEKHIAVIPEANIPLSGFHDLVCVLLAGHHFYGCNAKHENDLLEFVTRQLVTIEPQFAPKIHWGNNFPKNIDSYLVCIKADEVIHKTYFQKKHSHIREKNFSIGILTPDDTIDDLKSFGNDIFTFFGLDSHGLRKLFIPQGFILPRFLDAMEEYAWIYQYNRYANNYDYHKSVFLMERIPFLDNGFIVLRESVEQKVPVGCLYFEYYRSAEELETQLNHFRPYIQGISTNSTKFQDTVKPGCLHQYSLCEFENHKDTVQFLVKN